MFAVDERSPPGLTNAQLRAKRPALIEWSVRKTTNSDEPDDAIVDRTEVQNVPSEDELVMEPSYRETLS